MSNSFARECDDCAQYNGVGCLIGNEPSDCSPDHLAKAAAKLRPSRLLAEHLAPLPSSRRKVTAN